MIEVLGGMPKLIKTPEGKDIPFEFSIQNHWLIPKPIYFRKDVWLYDIMGIKQFLQALVDMLKKTQLIEKVTGLRIRADFKLGKSIKELILQFKIDDWYDKEILDSITARLRLLPVNADVEQYSKMSYGHFTIKFRYSDIDIPFKEIEELLDNGD